MIKMNRVFRFLFGKWICKVVGHKWSRPHPNPNCYECVTCDKSYIDWEKIKDRRR